MCAAALTTGRIVLMRDRAFYTRYLLAVTSIATDFLQTEGEYRAIRGRSRSLSPVDRSRLERIADFIETELQDRERFRGITQRRYRSDRDLRRNLERWVETLINAAIDIGKVVLSSAAGRCPIPTARYLRTWRPCRASPDCRSACSRWRRRWRRCAT